MDALVAGRRSGFERASLAARHAGEAIEAAIHAELELLLDQSAPMSVSIPETALRLALVDCLGWDDALAVRKRVAAPEEPLYVCRGNPVFGPEQYDYAGPPGCRGVFRGQWRRSRHGREGLMGRELVALGPRCDDCRKRMTADLEIMRGRRQRVLS